MLTRLINTLLLTCFLNFVSVHAELPKITVLTGPGFGWDYLKDTSAYPIFDFTYNENRTTNDGKYRIPDCVVAEDIKETNYQQDSEDIQTASTFVSKTSSYNSEFTRRFCRGGTYSSEYQKLYEEQRNTRTVTTTTKYVTKKYSLIISSRCPLNSNFKKWIDEIRQAYESGNSYLARTLSQYLIKEYGSHYVQKAVIGGMIYMDDYISYNFWKQHRSTTSIQKWSSYKFSWFFKYTGAGSTSTTTSDYSSYTTNVKKTKVDSIGGNYLPGMSLTDWVKTLDNNLVSIDRSFDLIANTISTSNFPQMSISTLYTIRNYLDKSFNRFVTVNTRSGCVEMDSINYSPIANFDPEDSNNCKEQRPFGGVFASSFTCAQSTGGVCSALQYACQELHFTLRDRKCPPGFTAKTGFLVSNPWLNLTECFSTGTIQNGNILFGGIYSATQINPVTGTKSCPEYFTAQSLLDCNKNVICLSTNFQRDIEKAVPFGGFISSCLPQLQDSCPEGFVKYFINSYKGCDLSYCTKIKNYNLPQIVYPEPEAKLTENDQEIINKLLDLNKKL